MATPQQSKPWRFGLDDLYILFLMLLVPFLAYEIALAIWGDFLPYAVAIVAFGGLLAWWSDRS